jgi:hypothetical protein
MRIPDAFTVHGIRYKVKVTPGIVTETDCKGTASYRTNEIRLCPIGEMGTTLDSQCQIFYHELMHILLHEQSYAKKRDDDAFVDRIASVLFEAIKSMEYND